MFGVEHKASPAYHQSVNGLAEKVIHEIYSITRTLTHAALLTYAACLAWVRALGGIIPSEVRGIPDTTRTPFFVGLFLNPQPERRRVPGGGGGTP